MNATLDRRWILAIRCASLVMLLSMVFLPQLTFAQDGNPFTNAEAQSGALGLIKSLVFWCWIACGIGVLLWVMAYFAQPILPQFYNQLRDYLRNGVLIMLLLNIVVSFILAQAEGAQNVGSRMLPVALAMVGLG